MRSLTLDFETFYSQDYSLSKMTTEEYVRDIRFEALCLAVVPWGERGFVLTEEEIGTWIANQDWDNISVVLQHAHFDGFILSERYHATPAYYCDTLSMARAVHGPFERASLAALCERYGLESKTVPYNRFRGMRWRDMDDSLRTDLTEGCLHDARLTSQIFRRMILEFPKWELAIIDATVRMYTQPRVVGDAELLESIAKEEFDRKKELMVELGVTEADLQSSATLLRLLEDLGEEVPRKAAKGGSVPCFAADDDYVLENSVRDDKVGKLLRARIDVKSTITETRAARLAAMARRGPLPIYHKYCTAITMRWGGGEKTNIQNLPRCSPMKSALMAPEGYSFVILDFSQIEYRICCALAGQKDPLTALAEGRDLYCEFGSELFNRLITRSDDVERQFSKVVILSSGYGAGKERCANMTKARGLDFPRKLTDRAIDLYRERHGRVVQLWGRLDGMLPRLASGGKCHIPETPLRFGDGRIILPNGLKPKLDMAWCPDTRKWFVRCSRGDAAQEGDTYKMLFAKGYTTFWGGALTGYACQSLARIRLSDFILQAKTELGLMPVFLVHDEYVCLARDKEAETMMYEMLELARRPSSWWWPNGPPYDAEARVAKRYGK
jgi:hypothetical protein